MALTLGFVFISGYCFVRCLLPGRAGHRHAVSDWISDVAHLVMGASMVMMLWWPAHHDRWGVQMGFFFTLAALWLLVRAVDGRQSRPRRVALVHQGIAMAAMVWMFVIMDGFLVAPTAAGASSAGHHVAHSSTANMTVVV